MTVRGMPLRGAPAEDVFGRMVRVVQAALQVPVAALAVVEREHLSVAAAAGLPEWIMRRPLLFPRDSAVGRALATGQPVLLARSDDGAERVDVLSRELRLVAHAAHPVLDAAGQVIGAIWAADRAAHEWSTADFDVLRHTAAAVAGEFARFQEAQQTQDRMRLQAVFLEELFQRAPEGIVVLDNHDRVMRANPEFLRLFGFRAEEVVGRPINHLIVRESELESARALSARAAGGETYEVELVRLRKDGTPIHVSLLTTPVRTAEGQHAVYAIYRDITERRWAEDEIQRNERRFRSLIENARETVFIVGAGGALEYASPSVERMLGYPVDAIRSRNVFAVLHPDEAPRVIEEFSDFVRAGRPGRSGGMELRVRHRAGEWRTLEVRVRNLLADPAVAGIVVNARDVTEERQAEQSQHRLNAFLEATPDFVATLDPHGRALSVNAAFRRLAGIGEDDDLRSVTLPDLYPPAATERILHEGIPTAAREEVWFGEVALHRPGQDPRIVSQMILAHRDQSGTLEFLALLARDITERKQAESLLRQSEQHFRSLIENAQDIILVLDADGVVRFESPATGRVLGYPRGELRGLPLLELVHPLDAGAVEGMLRTRRSAEEPTAPTEIRCRHADGGWRVLEMIGANLIDDPAVGGVVVNLRDVTERRAAEEALHVSQTQLLQSQKMEAVGRLAGGVAHDFNNLLTAIKGFTELLLLDFDPRDPRRPFVTEIQSAANRAAALTRQLLAFSRKQVLQPKVLDPNAVVSDMEKMLRRLIGEDIEFVTQLDLAAGNIRADPGQMEQVLMNLAVNARDAMPEGGRLSITTRDLVARAGAADDVVPGPGRYVLLSVSDTGCGMPPEVRERIFEPFYTTKEQGKGTGLGLSTVYGILQQSGGHIAVQSEPGRGTTFEIYLPRVDEGAERGEHPVPSGGVEGRETVLLAEDEQAVRILVRRVLERKGYRVLESDSGSAALDLAARTEEPIHLLLTDVVMPGMSGRELADRLLVTRPDLPVLFMSGYTDEAIVHHGVLDPNVHLVEKPFTPDALLRRVRAVLDGAATHSGG